MRICSECGTEYTGNELFCPKDGGRIVDPDNTGQPVRRRSISPGDTDDPLVGKTVQGRYCILRRIGEGGMGVVYVAEHVDIEKKVALKVLRDDFSKKPDVVERFRQEARSASKIGSPHIVDVTDFGQLDDGGFYFVMELLEGRALDELCAEGPVPLERAAPIIDQLAKALQAAHDAGIVHRDMKPENVFLVRRGEQEAFVKILDFGIARISDKDGSGRKLTQTGMVFGTPEYMSPEQAAGKPSDHRVDIYALGCMMFELFTGQVPYRGDSFMAILTQHMFEPIPDIQEMVPDTDVPASVLDVVYKAMTKEAGDRYQKMSDLRTDLAAALEDGDFVVEYGGREQSASFSLIRVANRDTESVSRRGVARRRRSRRWPRRALWIGMAAVVSTAIVLFVVSVIGSGDGIQEDTGSVLSPTKPPLPQIDDAPPIDASALSIKTDKVADTDAEEDTDDRVPVILGSIPPGAVMLVEGMGQVCSSAPCAVSLRAGHPLEITAMVGDFEKTRVFTPSKQNVELIIELDIGKRRTGGSGGKRARSAISSKTKKETGPAETPSGLKIPDVFQKP